MRFTHDCDECIYLGSLLWTEYKYTEENVPYLVTHQRDVYFCPRADGGSIVSRYGNRGHEYYSAPYEMGISLTDPGFNAGLIASIKRGLIDPNKIPSRLENLKD